MAVDAGPKLDPTIEVEGRHLVANSQHVRVGQTGEALDVDVHRLTGGAAPAHLAGQQTTTHIQCPLVVQHFPTIHAEALSIHQQNEGQPIRCVSQFGVHNRCIIEDAVDQRGRSGARIPLFEGPPRPQVAVADGEDGFLVVELLWIELGFADEPVFWIVT